MLFAVELGPRTCMKKQYLCSSLHKARLRAGTPTNSAISLQKQKQLPTGDSQSKVTKNMQSKPSNVSKKLTQRQKETTAFA